MLECYSDMGQLGLGQEVSTYKLNYIFFFIYTFACNNGAVKKLTSANPWTQ